MEMSSILIASEGGDASVIETVACAALGIITVSPLTLTVVATAGSFCAGIGPIGIGL